jgi:hypothetical protein
MGMLSIPLALMSTSPGGGGYTTIFNGPAVVNGAGMSTGTATNFGSGMASGTNFIGTGSGSGTSAATGVAAADGAILLNQYVFNVNTTGGGVGGFPGGMHSGMMPLGPPGTGFNAMSVANSNFNNAGSGTFGNPGTLYIP